MNSDLDLGVTYRRLLAGWLWIIAAAMVGALLGLGLSYLRPPVYEATAVIGIGIDRSRADVPDDITVRQAFDRVRGLLLADDTLEEALALGAARAGEEAPLGEVRAFTDRLRLSERPDGWVLAVLGRDASETERMAQAWADVSLAQLQTASYHAIRAAEWQAVLYEASCRLVPPESDSEEARWLCRSAAPEGDSSSIPSSILVEVEASRGILPALTYSLMRRSDGTAAPVVWGRGTLVLGGAIAGMVIGSLLVASVRRGLPGLAPLR
jgi:hypothetical protein